MESRGNGPPRGGERRWLRWLAFSVAGSLGLAIVVALATLIFGGFPMLLDLLHKLLKLEF